MKNKNWEKYRREDGSIDLVRAWQSEHTGEERVFGSPALTNLKLAEAYQPIKSRQVAALALAHADYIHMIWQLPNGG